MANFTQRMWGHPLCCGLGVSHFTPPPPLPFGSCLEVNELPLSGKVRREQFRRQTEPLPECGAP